MKSKLEAHGIHDLKEYKAAIARSNLPKAQKERLLASPQIPTHDRESHSPLGGRANGNGDYRGHWRNGEKLP